MAQPITTTERFHRGTTLKMILADGLLDLGRLKSIAFGVLDALDRAHESGMRHAPLRPEMLYVADHDSVQIAPLGLEPIQPLDAAPHFPTGNDRLYGPPEPRDDTQSDLYALGVILYQAAAGLAPGGADDFGPIAAAREHFIKTATPPSTLEGTIPPDWDEFVVRALEVGSGSRFRDAAEMRAALVPLSTERLPPPEVSFPAPETEVGPPDTWEVPALSQSTAAALPTETSVDVLRHREPEAAVKSGRRGVRTGLLVLGSLIILGLAAGVTALLPRNTLANIIPFRPHPNGPAPVVPAPVSPADGAIVTHTAVRLCWTRAPSAAEYLVRLAPGGARHEKNPCATMTLRPGAYSWTVSAIAGGGAGLAGKASKGQRFTVRPVPTPTPTSTSTPKPSTPRRTAVPTKTAASSARKIAPTAIPVQAAPVYVPPTPIPAPVIQAPAAPAAPAPTPAPAAPVVPSNPPPAGATGSGASCIPFVNC